jgi:hypothetical protein
MAAEWTVVLRFEDYEIPNEEEFERQMEDDWSCIVIDIESEDV